MNRIEFAAEKEVLDFIKTELKRQRLTCVTIAHLSGVKLSSLRRIMSKKARQPLLLREVNALYQALGYLLVPLAVKQAPRCTVSRVSLDYALSVNEGSSGK